ncbi:B- and T-lymphocyte attenuator [Anableps anableps]
MRPDHHWIALSWSIWTVLFLTSKADNNNCSTDLKVRRNTVHKAILGQQLRIECPAVFCNNLPPTICWYKMEEEEVCLNDSNTNHIKTGWEARSQSTGTSYLFFQSLVSSDLGEYRCRSGGSVSHTINITVSDNQSKTELTDKFLMYMYSAAGIGSFVIIVIIISVICIRGCKGKSRKEEQKSNQYMEIPLAEQAIPNATRLQHSPRGNPNPLPPGRASRRKSPGQPGELTTSRDNEQLYGQRTRDRNRNVTQVDEPGSVVYAALNHGLPPREAPRPQRQIEETEYAAIRLV